MTRIEALTMTVALAVAGVAGGVAGEPGRPADGRLDVGVVVEETAGASVDLRDSARAQVADLRRRGVRAELRLARSPSEALGAAATLATRGADRLVLVGADPVVLELLRGRLAHVELDVRGHGVQSTAMTAPPRRGSAPPVRAPVTTSRSTAWAPPK